jgi:hypothetical protein
VVLEARALKPLGHHRVARAVGLGLRRGERQAKQRQALGLAGAAPAIELQAVAVPVAQERLAQVVPGLAEKPAAGPRLLLGEAGPVAALAAQLLIAQPAEQHIVGRAVLGVGLEALALEPLGIEAALGRALRPAVAQGQPKHRQPAVALPEAQELAGSTSAGGLKAALALLGQAWRGREQRQQHDQN